MAFGFARKTWGKGVGVASAQLTDLTMNDFEGRVEALAADKLSRAEDPAFEQTWSAPGSMTTAESDIWRAPAAATGFRYYLRARGAPVGSDLVVVVRVNGTQAASLTILAGATGAGLETQMDSVTAVPAEAKLTVQATSVGSTTAATGVVAQIVGTRT